MNLQYSCLASATYISQKRYGKYNCGIDMTKYYKFVLTILGAHSPLRLIGTLRNILNYIRLGRWMRDNQFQVPKRLRNRTAVFNAVAKELQNSRVLYLEFGVWTGRSLRYWSHALKHPLAALHGFDSFEGIPESFDHRCKKGAMDVGGVLPEISDERIAFYKGWFEDTLPNYSPPNHECLFINVDCDLYSSTKTVLYYLKDYIKSGTYIYFDDLSRTDHEALAFEEFMQDTGKHFELVATDLSLNTSCFRCIQ